MINLIERAAYDWGKVISSYGRHVIKTGQVKCEGLENLPKEATIWYTWHQFNLMALAFHPSVTQRPTQSFVPPGIIGTSMSGWLEGAGLIPIQLPTDGIGNPSSALKAMIRGLSKDGDVVVAVDGPHGPVGEVRPGTFWLGKMTGRPLMAVGFAARPSFRIPRWDQHLVPLPRAKLAMVFGKPIHVTRDQEIDEPFLESIKDHLNSIAKRAEEIL
ncbi:MAG: hypothetical protein H7Y59_19630 [Anaerolineales bacterium]|nr:hypothetical protein [Anaerolineales bacterium]